jgi:dUTP pyrophosphatase
MEYTLLLKPLNEKVRSFYKNHGHYHKNDSGIDLFTPNSHTVRPGDRYLMDLEIQCQMVDGEGNEVPYYVRLRSSTTKNTPLELSNGVGVMDIGYRGNVKAALTYVPTYDILLNGPKNKEFTIGESTRLVQICSRDLSSINLRVVDELSETERGSGGFGSTGM